MPKTMKRRPISGPELYLLLNREFEKQQPRECQACYVQFPYRVDRVDPSNANWELVLPPECPSACRAVLEEVVSEFSLLYDLDVDAER